MVADCGQKGFAQVVGLSGSDAFDRQQLGESTPAAGTPFPERRIVANHVWRHAPRSRDLEPDGTQAIEQRSIHVLP